MIRKKFVEVKATITDGEQDLGVYTYVGKPISDMRLLKMVRAESKNDFATLKGIIKTDKVFEMTEDDFIKYATVKEN
jgi:hypothetical protein